MTHVKPHLYIKFGVWCCVSCTADLRRFRLGYGYSASDAYADWEAQPT